MILHELHLSSGTRINFELGLNIILGQNRDTQENMEAKNTADNNGIGKTTIVRIISHILGGPSEGAIDSQFFEKNKHWASLQILKAKKSYVISRPLWSPLSDQCVILFEGDMIDFHAALIQKKVILKTVNDVGRLNNLLGSHPKIAILSKGEAQNFITRIENIDYSQGNLKFSALLDFIIRDEKRGFSDIISRSMRKEWTQYRSIQYLFGLPAFIESSAANLKKEEIIFRNIARNASEYLKEQGVGDISAIQNEEVKTTQKLNAIRADLKELNVVQSIENLQESYSRSKANFVELNSEVSLKTSQLLNFSANLKDLNEKEIAISDFIDIDAFYEELVGVFPDNVAGNFDAYREFFASVSKDRKAYYKRLIERLRREIRELKVQRSSVATALNELSGKLEGTSLVSDISALVKAEERLENSLRNLARAKEKLSELESSNEAADEKKADRDTALKIGKIQEKMDRKKRQSLIQLFHDLVEGVYSREDGTISFEYINETKSTIAGRTKIDAKIPSDKSKGRTFSKICLFDYVWFLKPTNEEDYSPEFLIHDGPFSGISPEPKKNILKLIAAHSLKQQKQYIITLNTNELPKDMSEIDYHVPIVLDGSSVQGKLYGEQYE